MEQLDIADDVTVDVLEWYSGEQRWGNETDIVTIAQTVLIGGCRHAIVSHLDYQDI